MSRESYDADPYPAQPFAPSHPRNLEAVATLFGLAPPPISTARILELGCATGGNLVPMAAALPDANFVGIDYSPIQIEHARRFADALSLKNITFEPLSVFQITPELGTFDYIIAHGFMSWVRPDAHQAAFAVMGKNLSAKGVAYASFNVFPGWHARQWMREMMVFHAPEIEGQSAEDRVKRARQICEIVAESPEIKGTPAGEMLQREMANWINRPPRYVIHEYLDESNWPFYFHDFVSQAKSHGLQYLADAQNNSSMFETGTPQNAALLQEAGDDIVRREQYLDFIRNTTFRRTLLVHADRNPDRKTLADRIESMWVTSTLTNDSPPSAIATSQAIQFAHPSGLALNVNHPLTKAALTLLQSTFPQPTRVNELLDQAIRLASVRPDERARATLQLLNAWSMNLVQLYVTPPPLCTRPGDRPEIWKVARQQAASGMHALTNLRHEVVAIEPPFGQILGAFDGAHTRDQIAAQIISNESLGLAAKFADKPVVGRQVATRAMEALLERFGKESLMVG
ncbi:lysine methyltransferase [soil metagenome]